MNEAVNEGENEETDREREVEMNGVEKEEVAVNE